MSEYQSEYGIICKNDDEKKVVKSINDFLEKEHGYRKLYKRNKDHSLTKARLPFEYEHFYQQFLKQGHRWYFELYPNSDLNFKMKFTNHPEVGWIIFINKLSYSDLEAQESLDKFFTELINSIDFEIIFLHQYKHGDERL